MTMVLAQLLRVFCVLLLFHKLAHMISHGFISAPRSRITQIKPSITLNFQTRYHRKPFDVRTIPKTTVNFQNYHSTNNRVQNIREMGRGRELSWDKEEKIHLHIICYEYNQSLYRIHCQYVIYEVS